MSFVGGPVVQWSERAAHNGVVGGSNPSGAHCDSLLTKIRRLHAALIWLTRKDGTTFSSLFEQKFWNDKIILF